MIEKYTPTPTNNYCFICGEPLYFEERVGGKVTHGGVRCAHKKCWDEEQAELKEATNKCD